MAAMPGMGMTPGTLGMERYIPLVNIRKKMSPFPPAAGALILLGAKTGVNR